VRREARVLAVASAAALAACGETVGAHVDVAFYVQGSEARAVEIPGATLTLSEAQVSLGPLYLCATESAESALCETALGERLDVLVIDALDGSATRMGELSATTGTVRSAFFDYGLSWLLTKPGPTFAEGARFKHSARLRFHAEGDDGSTLEVEADIDIAPLAPGDAAVNGRRTEQTLGKQPLALTLALDASVWLTRIRSEELSALDEDGDGRVILPADSQPYEAILQGMTAREPPRFLWSEE
jgi:hypothetical protein